MKNLKLLFIVAALFFLNSCEELSIEDSNNPTEDQLFMTTDFTQISNSYSQLYHDWFIATHQYDGQALGLWIMADAGTSSWGGLYSYFAGIEPAIVFDNSEESPHYSKYYHCYKSLHNILNLSNKLIKISIANNDIVYEDTKQNEMLSAYGYFMQGITLGYLGLLYEKGFVITETTNISRNIETSGYKELINQALISLDKAIAICNVESFTIPASWIPLEITLDETAFGQLVNSYAARILSYSPRNATENENLDWERIYTYASNGIDYDFSPIADDIGWYSLYHTYANYGGFGWADMRIAHMMDPDMPARWPGENGNDGYDYLPEPKNDPADAYDNRIITDFEYLSHCDLNPGRGSYFFSCYRFSRYDDYLSTWVGPMPEMYKAENDLLIAEAALMIEKYIEAANIINSGTRVTRGGLPPISQDPAEIEDAIFHERNIELFCSGMGVEYFTMRKADRLQYGTILHFPIPASELTIMDIENYTFGPEVGSPGVDYSIGGWD